MSELAEVKDAIDELRCDVKEILQKQATTAAKLDTLGEQSSAQIGVLFGRRDKDVERIQRIELDYTPKCEHRELKEKVERIDRQVAKWIGALALIQVLLSAGAAWLMKAVLG